VETPSAGSEGLVEHDLDLLAMEASMAALDGGDVPSRQIDLVHGQAAALILH